MWWRFGWRSGWVTKQSRLMFPARGVRECFMLPYWDRKLRGKQRESQTLTWKLHSAVLYSPHRESCVYLLFFFFFLSVSPLNTHTHIYTLAHGCITNIVHMCMHRPSYPQFETKDCCTPSGWDKNLNLICCFKIFCFVPLCYFSVFAWDLFWNAHHKAW